LKDQLTLNTQQTPKADSGFNPLDAFVMLRGDCLEIMPKLEKNSVDLILSDLPYEQTACDWDSIIDFNSLWYNYKRVLKQNGVIALTAAQPFTTAIINSNPSWFKYCWYWQKNQGTNFFHAKRMPIRKIEEILIFYNGKVKYYPQITDGHIPTNSAKGCSNGVVYHGNNKRDYKGGKTTRYPINLLDFKCVNNYERVHPNQKPVELMEYLIKTYTDDGDTILDNAMGSGSTGVACKNLNRRFIGIEKDEKYFEIAKQRIEAT